MKFFREKLSRWQMFFCVLFGLSVLGGIAGAVIPAIRASGVQIDLNTSYTGVIASGKTGIWGKTSDGLPYWHKADNTDVAMTGGGGGGSSTLATAYTTGASQTDSTMLLDSTRLGVRIRDNATPIAGALFSIQNSAGSTSYQSTTPTASTFAGNILPEADNTRDIGAAGTRYAHVYTPEVDSGGTNDLLFQTNNFDRLTLSRTGANVLTSGVTNGAAAIGNVIDSFNALSTSGAKLLSLRTGGNERAYMELDTIVTGSFVLRQPSTTYMAFFDSSSNGFKIQSGLTYFRAGGSDVATVDTALLRPATSLSAALGSSTYNWASITGYVINALHDAIGTAQTAAMIISNTTAATSGSQQFSPMSWLYGQRYSGAVTKQVGYGWQADSPSNGTDAGYMSLWSSYDGSATKRLTFGLDPIFGAGWQLLQLVDGSTFDIFDSSRAGISINSGNVFVYMAGNAVATTTAAKMGPTGAFGLTSGSGTVPWSTTYSRHYGSYQLAIPNITAGAGAGTTPTVSVSAGSTDTAGTINITTGTTPTGTAATIVTITFNTAFDSAPRCQIVPSSSATAGLTNAQFANVPQASTSTTVFIVQSGATALTASTAYVWNYQCIQ